MALAEGWQERPNAETEKEKENQNQSHPMLHGKKEVDELLR